MTAPPARRKAEPPVIPGDIVHVLIVDDSAVMRAVLSRMIAEDARFSVVGTVPTAARALDFLAVRTVDIIVLDLELPGTGGLEALPGLLAAGAGARVLIVSSACDDGDAASVAARQLGAADTLMKPGAGVAAARFGERLIEKLGQLADPSPMPVATSLRGDPFDIVAIGASTGGIHALGAVLREVPAAMTAPILVTQHLPHAFSSYFAAQLADLARRPCVVATDRMRVMPGHVIVAPGDAHLVCVALGKGGTGSTAIRLSREPAASGCMPSVDPMFASLAQVRGARALGVLLSGMGRDGTDGARHLREAGAGIVVQDRASSVVWGMPGAAVAAGVVDTILPPDAIGRLIATGRKPR